MGKNDNSPYYKSSKNQILQKFGINLYQNTKPYEFGHISADKRRLLEETVKNINNNQIQTNKNSICPSDMWKDKKEVWTWLLSLFTATIIVFVGRMSMPICEVEIAEEFNWDEEKLGKVMSVFFWGYAVTQIPGGAAAAQWLKSVFWRK